PHFFSSPRPTASPGPAPSCMPSLSGLTTPARPPPSQFFIFLSEPPPPSARRSRRVTAKEGRLMNMNKKTVLGVLGTIAIGSAVGFAWLRDSGPRELRLPGVVETQEVRLSSKIGGRIRRVAVQEGQTVRAGQELVTLEAPELEARREQVQAAL